MIFYQDYEKATNKAKFILDSVFEYQQSDLFTHTTEALSYLIGNDETIGTRQFVFFAGDVQIDKFKANHKVPSEFFKKIVQQKVSYLLGNGLRVDDKIKKKLGRRFDLTLQRAGKWASISSVSYVYSFMKDGKMGTKEFNSLEFCPIFDKNSGELKAGIRFWKLSKSAPLNIEFYDLDGVTIYRKNGSILEEVTPKILYATKKLQHFPITPLYNNDTKTSDFTKSLKEKIDLYNIVLSDFGNNLEDNNDVYWVIKNYDGESPEEFMQKFKAYKMLKISGDGDATPHSFEVPYQARERALEIIRKDIYEQSMSVDTSVLSGGSLTNIAIKANMLDLGLKCDEFEYAVLDCIDNILLIANDFGINTKDAEPKLIRRDIINDAELVQNLQLFRDDISHRTALELNPYIENVDEELVRIEEERRDKFSLEDELEDEEVDNGQSTQPNGTRTE